MEHGARSLTSWTSIAVFLRGSTSLFRKSLEGGSPAGPVVCVHEWPPVNPFPGARMSCRAPAARIPSIAAWSFSRTSCVGCERTHCKSLNAGNWEQGHGIYHAVRLVVDSEDDLGVVDEPARELLPERAELLGGRCCRVGAVSNNLWGVNEPFIVWVGRRLSYTARERLHRRVTV